MATARATIRRQDIAAFGNLSDRTAERKDRKGGRKSSREVVAHVETSLCQKSDDPKGTSRSCERNGVTRCLRGAAEYATHSSVQRENAQWIA